MKITGLFVAFLIGIVLPGLAIADEQAASFETRWPEQSMRKPTMTELIRERRHYVGYQIGACRQPTGGVAVSSGALQAAEWAVRSAGGNSGKGWSRGPHNE